MNLFTDTPARPSVTMCCPFPGCLWYARHDGPADADAEQFLKTRLELHCVAEHSDYFRVSALDPNVKQRLLGRC